MRNRRKTIESLRRLAERPGTEAEGQTATLLLRRLEAHTPVTTKWDQQQFPRFTAVFYNCWGYEPNQPGTIVGKEPKQIEGQTWVMIKFDYLKSPRRVPVTSARGCHISASPLGEEETEYLGVP